MEIDIEKIFFETYIEPFLSENSFIKTRAKSSFSYGSDLRLPVSALSLEDLNEIYELAKKSGEGKKLMTQITPIRRVLEDSEGSKVTSLKALAVGIMEYIKKDAINGWLYHQDRLNVPQPYLVKNIVIKKPYSKEERPFVEVDLVANSPKGSDKKGLHTKTITFNTDDIKEKTIPEILSTENFFKETNELTDIYEQHVKMFMDYRPRYSEQFWVEGNMYDEFDRWGSAVVYMSKNTAVNDEETIKRQFTSYIDAKYWRENGFENGFDKVPFHCYIRMFHLHAHKQMWVHASNMIPYEYDESIREKLILKPTNRDLIDILVENMDILQEDIVRGKSGGTTILCVGDPGLGKTLTAEVYSEVVKRPLYRVDSGELGLNDSEVQENLEKILKRAARWKAVLLLDEADVYIRKRGNDLHQNAIVAAFLRTMEYFDGLLFMTTNRGEDVDNAILSRCIAVIKYEIPTPEDAKRIWEVLSSQFQIHLSEDMIDELVRKFPKISGRDIKELLKLTSRFAKGKGVDLSIDVFRQCAQFRAIEIVE